MDRQPTRSRPKKVTQSKTEVRIGPSRAKVDDHETVGERRQRGTLPTRVPPKDAHAEVRLVRKPKEKKKTGIRESHSSKKLTNSRPTQEQTVVNSKKATSDVPVARVEGRLAKGQKLGLLSALRDGQLDVVKEALAKGTDMNAPVPGKSLLPLYIAAKGDHVEILQLLIKHNASVHGISGKRGTALHAAADGSSLGAINALLEHGADVNAVNQSGKTPLHMAAKNADIDAMAILLEAGADANVLAREITPLDLVIEKVKSERESHLDKMKLLIAHGARLSHWEQEKLIQECVSAITRGIMDLVEIFLDNGCDPNGYIEGEQLTLLGIAAKSGFVEIGELLLDRGAATGTEPSPLLLSLQHNHPLFVDLLLKRDAQNSPLGLEKMPWLRIVALEVEMDDESRGEMLRVLVRNGVSIDAMDSSSFNTVLHEAVLARKLETIQILLELGADVNAQNSDKMTPLMLACIDNNIDAAQIIIESGRTDVCCTASDGSHALLEAVEHESEELVLLLLAREAPVNLPRGDGVFPLYLAVSKLNPGIVKLLLEAGAGVNQKNSQGVSPLSIACKFNHSLLASLLLEAGADPNQVDDLGETPLHAAILGRADDRLIEMLLTDGADANAKTKDGVPPAILALRSDNFSAIYALINSGKTDLNDTTTDGSHLLYEAVRRGCDGWVLFLLSRGATVDLAGPNGKTSLGLAVENSDHVSAKMLLDEGADISIDGGSLLAGAIENDDLDMLDLLLEAGVDVSQADAVGEVPLNLACKHDRTDIVSTLLDAGAGVNWTFDGEKTPLMTAVLENANREVVEKLLRAGAFTDVVASDGDTCLHIAASNRQLEIVNLLLRHGANPFIRNSSKKTAQDLAAQFNFDEIVGCFENYILAVSFAENLRIRPSVHPKDFVPTAAVKPAIDDMEKVLVCPITLEVMEDPVITPDGLSYERSAITEWLNDHPRSPMTHEPMNADQLVPNIGLKQQIEIYLKLAHEVDEATFQPSCSRR